MALISKLNKRIRFLLCVTDIFRKYALVVPLKDKESATIVDAFKKILNDSMELDSKSSEAKSKGRKPNNIWVDQGSEFYNNFLKKWLKDNDTDDIVNEYNNAYHRTIKMKLVDVKDNAYIDSAKEVNNKDLKFQVDNHVKISKYKNIFAKGHTPK